MSNEVQSLHVASADAGARLDTFLAARMADISRTRIQRAIDDGDVLVNDRPAKPSYHVRPDDVIEIDLPEPPPVELTPEPIPINVVFEDADLIVVDKPAGLVVHPGAGQESGTLANALVYHFNQLSGNAGRVRPGIVHRIDKETSGLLVVAKNDSIHEKLSNQFRDREVLKRYVALVHGTVKQARGQIDAPLGRHAVHRTRMAVFIGGGYGRPAITLYEVATRYHGCSLLNVQIKTGRTHQIRVHLAHIGHPVVGDATYGGGRDKTVSNLALRRAIAALGRHFLHSTALGFTHPRTGERLEFWSPLPAELSALINLVTEQQTSKLGGLDTDSPANL